MFPRGPVPKHLFKEYSILHGLQRKFHPQGDV